MTRVKDVSQTDKPDAVILAGGRGSRVGGEDKGLMHWNGKALIRHTMDRLEPQVNNIVISCNRNVSQYRQHTGLVLKDSRTNFQGPLSGLDTARHHLVTDIVIVVPCDTPLLPTDLVERLLKPLLTGGGNSPEISYAHDGTRAHYLCCAVRKNTLETLDRYLEEGGRSVQGWYRQQLVVEVDFSDQVKAFHNFNSRQAFTGH